MLRVQSDVNNQLQTFPGDNAGVFNSAHNSLVDDREAQR